MNALEFFNPPYNKGTIGFDDMFKRLASLTDSVQKIQQYPPYNIVKVDENKYLIEMALAGFGKQDIELTLEEGVLTIKGNISTETPSDYYYKGIADRSFSRTFTLADNVEIRNANLINGMLKIWLDKIVPESKKFKKIEIEETETTPTKKLKKE